MKCVICGIEINSIEESIEQGWIPYLNVEGVRLTLTFSCKVVFSNISYYIFHARYYVFMTVIIICQLDSWQRRSRGK